MHRIFQWIRHWTRGRAPAVKDVGDFIAHRDARNEGVSWQRGVDFCHMIALTLRHHNDKSAIDRDTIVKGALASFRSLGPAGARKQFQKGARKVEKILRSALDKVDAFDGSELLVSQHFTEQEKSIFDYYRQRIIVAPAITSTGLMDQLCQLLRDNGILSHKEEPELRSSTCFIAAYAMSQIHGADLLEGDKVVAKLQLATWDALHVMVSTRVGGVDVLGSVVTSDCAPADWCDEKLIGNSLLERPIELNRDGKLVYI